MSRKINASLLGLSFFLAAYCLCFVWGIMPKFYPLLGEIHITPPQGNHIAVKFVGSAVVGMVAALLGYLVGLRLPERLSTVLHVLAWLTLAVACAYLINREGAQYLWS